MEYEYDTYEPGQVSPEPGFNDAPEFAQGRLIGVRDRGSHTRFNYDARGRVRRTSRRVVKPAGFTPNIGDGYVDHWLAQRVDFDVAGRVTSKTSGADLPELLVGGGSVESYSYSARGAVQRIDSSYGLLIDHIAYEADGQPSLIRYGDLAQTETSFSYDVRRRLQFMDTHRSSPQLWSTGPFTAAYPQPTWRTTQTSLANVELRYDGVGNPTEIFDYADPDQYRHDDKLPVYRRGMQYDDLYRVTRVDYHYNAAANPVGFRSPYLPEVNAGDTRPVPLQLQLSTRVAQQSFDYDFLGNTTSTSDDLGASYDRSLGPVTHGASTDGPNQLRGANGIEASYDAAGNITELRVQRQGDCISGGVNKCAQWFAYDWDEVGQLAKARRWDFDTLPVVAPGEADAPAWSLTYAYSLGARVLKSSKDAAGERHTLEVFDTLRFERAPFVEQGEDYDRHRDNVQLYLGGGVGHVIYDSNYELPNLGSPIHRFINIGDHLGSANVTIDGDTSELVERATHEAFGAIESDYRPDRWNNAREPYKFTGKEEDIEVGLTYFGARYYQPHLGRWASADPLTIHGLGADLNPYAYVGGRVMSHVDPFGLDAEPVGGTNRMDMPDYGIFSMQMPDGSLEIRYIDDDPRASFAERVMNAAERGLGAVDALERAHVPLGGGNYATPGGVANNLGDFGRNVLVDQAIPLKLHHFGFIRGIGIDVNAVVSTAPKSNDPNDRSKLVATVIGVAATAGLGGGGEAAEAGAEAAASKVTVGGQPWRVFQPGEAACQRGCEAVAESIQKALGGEVKTFSSPAGPGGVLGGVRNASGVYVNPAGSAARGWFSHSVVVRNGRVYDALTGPGGRTIADYKAMWQYGDVINFGF